MTISKRQFFDWDAGQIEIFHNGQDAMKAVTKGLEKIHEKYYREMDYSTAFEEHTRVNFYDDPEDGAEGARKAVNDLLNRLFQRYDVGT